MLGVVSPCGPLPVISDSHKKTKVMTCPLQERTPHTTTIYMALFHMQERVLDIGLNKAGTLD